MSIARRNAYYRDILAARQGKKFSDLPQAMNRECITMWIAGYNDEISKILQEKQQLELIANML